MVKDVDATGPMLATVSVKSRRPFKVADAASGRASVVVKSDHSICTVAVVHRPLSASSDSATTPDASAAAHT